MGGAWWWVGGRGLLVGLLVSLVGQAPLVAREGSARLKHAENLFVDARADRGVAGRLDGEDLGVVLVLAAVVVMSAAVVVVLAAVVVVLAVVLVMLAAVVVVVVAAVLALAVVDVVLPRRNGCQGTAAS